jgi:hypothetical protein
MYKDKVLISLALFLLLLTSCAESSKNQEKQQESLPSAPATTLYHGIPSEDSRTCSCSVQFDLKDSLFLTHMKKQFYRSETGHLYEKTTGKKEINGHLVDFVYFNGYISQKVDPLSFIPLDGWYAKDKNYVYYYKPVSGGMQISKIDKADTKTFKMLSGHYQYAIDKNFYYYGTQAIDGFLTSKTRQKLNHRGKIIGITCGKKKYKLEL